MANHKHKFEILWNSNKEIGFKCRCGERKNRSLTKSEIKLMNKKYPLFPGRGNQSTDVHFVWHKFCDAFRVGEDLAPSEWDAEKLRENIDKWVKKYPDYIRVVSCDDSHHSSSQLILVEHKTETSYMGTTVVFVPQCSGEKPIEFFLYPNRTEQLILALKEIRVASKIIEKKEAKIDLKRSKEMNRDFKP